jgi:hypothetical protein
MVGAIAKVHPSPPRSPEAPVHERALLVLRRLELLVGDLLLKGETLVFRVRLLVTDVHAVTAVRVGITQKMEADSVAERVRITGHLGIAPRG